MKKNNIKNKNIQQLLEDYRTYVNHLNKILNKAKFMYYLIKITVVILLQLLGIII